MSLKYIKNPKLYSRMSVKYREEFIRLRWSSVTAFTPSNGPGLYARPGPCWVGLRQRRVLGLRLAHRPHNRNQRLMSLHFWSNSDPRALGAVREL